MDALGPSERQLSPPVEIPLSAYAEMVSLRLFRPREGAGRRKPKGAFFISPLKYKIT